VLTDTILLIVVGLVTGYLSGLFGIGGGLLRIPIFLHLMPAIGVPAALVMHVSAGTSLAVAVPTTLSASHSHHKAGNLDAGLLRTWLPALAVGVVIGIVGTHYLSGRILEGMFAVLVLGAGIRMLIPHAEKRDASAVHLRSSDADSPASGAETSEIALPSRPVLSIMALLIGIISPMVGIIGGTFTTPVLTACRYPIHRAVAVSCVGGLVVSVLGTIGFVITGWHAPGLPARFIGYVDPLALLVMTPCVLATVPLGVRMANRLSQRALTLLFALLLLVLALDVGRSAILWHGD